MNNKIGQLFFIGIDGCELSSEEEKFIVEKNIGGVILFERNISSLKQVHQLCSHLQSLAQKQPDKAPLFIATDLEGGRVATLKAPFTQWPSMRKLSALDSTSTSFKLGQLIGEELISTGINVNFAPCVDVLTNPANELIGDRSAGPDHEKVGKITSALVRGFIKANVIPCAKHFPGHGNTVVDSHEDLPVDQMSADDLINIAMQPFKKVFRARLDMVMTAHVKYPSIDADWPATLSEKFLKDLLRKDFRYKNLVVADDLKMEALAKHFDDRQVAIRALQSGVDMLMYAHSPDTYQQPYSFVQEAAAKKELDVLSLSDSHELVLKVKKSKLATDNSKSLTEIEKIIGCEKHLDFAAAIESGNVPQEK